MKNLKGRLTISRISCSNPNNNRIEIRIQDDASHLEFLTVYVPFLEFALAITGVGYQDCELELRDVKNVGKVREHKTEIVRFIGASDHYKIVPPAAIAAMQDFEVDGWIGYSIDMTNHNNRVRYDNKIIGYRVNFVRFV
jgi:hypothetical protein